MQLVLRSPKTAANCAHEVTSITWLTGPCGKSPITAVRFVVAGVTMCGIDAVSLM